MDAHEAETKPLREMKDERTQKTIAKIIWVLKEDSRGDKFIRVDMEGSGECLMIGIKDIFDRLAENLAHDWEEAKEDIRSVILDWMLDPKSVISDWLSAHESAEEETT